MLALKPWIGLELPQSVDTALSHVRFFRFCLVVLVCPERSLE